MSDTWALPITPVILCGGGGTRHDLEIPGKCHLETIEIKTCSYLGEDDAVRPDDHYGRHA